LEGCWTFSIVLLTSSSDNPSGEESLHILAPENEKSTSLFKGFMDNARFVFRSNEAVLPGNQSQEQKTKLYRPAT